MPTEKTVLQIASAGGDVEDVVAAVRELPVQHLKLLLPPGQEPQAEQIRSMLTPLGLHVEVVPVLGDPMLNILQLVAEALAEVPRRFQEVHINVSSGPREFGCACMSAAFVHGARAFHVKGGRPSFFPVLRLGYRDVLTEAKLGILRALRESDGSAPSITDLASRLGHDKSLLSYHLRGSKDQKGLEEMGLVEVERGSRGRLGLRLTPTALTLLSAYDAGDGRSLPAATGIGHDGRDRVAAK